jgi:hypothetical protein
VIERIFRKSFNLNKRRLKQERRGRGGRKVRGREKKKIGGDDLPLEEVHQESSNTSLRISRMEVWFAQQMEEELLLHELEWLLVVFLSQVVKLHEQQAKEEEEEEEEEEKKKKKKNKRKL